MPLNESAKQSINKLLEILKEILMAETTSFEPHSASGQHLQRLVLHEHQVINQEELLHDLHWRIRNIMGHFSYPCVVDELF